MDNLYLTLGLVSYLATNKPLTYMDDIFTFTLGITLFMLLVSLDLCISSTLISIMFAHFFY